MEELIELYLFRNKKCPLPALGVLEMTSGNAVAMYREGKIEAPVPSIKLSEASHNADDFIKYIAGKQQVSINEANSMLTAYCRKLQNMDAYEETKLPHAGKFYVNSDGNLVFKAIEVPAVFLPELTVERVIHPAVAHSMMVGDKQTTTTEMAAFFTEADPVTKDRWWIWALALAIVAAAGIFFYFNSGVVSSTVGSSRIIQPAPASETYRIAE